MIATTHYRLDRAMNSRYLGGRVPLLNILILLVEIIALSQLAMQYDLHFEAKPILTMMITNATLNAIADTVAQTVSSVRQQVVRKSQLSEKKDGVTIEIHELSETGTLPSNRGELHAASGSHFDFERLVRFMAWGFLMAPPTFRWFSFLAEAFPITEDSKTAPALWRVLLDQIVFSPLSLALFFAYMTAAEGGGRRAISRKFDSVFVSTLKSNYVLWPAVQILNFRVLPLQFQLLFASTIGVAWNIYLSLTNNSAEI
ncbi:hypothetical protein RUND412_002280 [Rhizina undulata]